MQNAFLFNFVNCPDNCMARNVKILKIPLNRKKTPYVEIIVIGLIWIFIPAEKGQCQYFNRINVLVLPSSSFC